MLYRILLPVTFCLVLLASPALAQPPRVAKWLATLPEAQQVTARAILRESTPEIGRLRKALRDTLDELAELDYNDTTPPERLPHLGRQVQELRKALRERLEDVDRRLREAVGSSPELFRGHGRHPHRMDIRDLQMDKN